jgi:hypothetical protein
MERHPMNLNLPPAVWLVIWLACTAVCCILVAWLFFQLGWDHCDREQYSARHKLGDDVVVPDPPGLPVAGRLDPFPGDDEDWSFHGGAQLEPRPGRDEYLLLMQQAVDRVSEASRTCETCTGETADEFTARAQRETDDFLDRIDAETSRLIRTFGDRP